MKLEHETYEILYNDVARVLERDGILKKLKEDIGSFLGRNEIVNQDTIEKT